MDGWGLRAPSSTNIMIDARKKALLAMAKKAPKAAEDCGPEEMDEPKDAPAVTIAIRAPGEIEPDKIMEIADFIKKKLGIGGA